MIKIQNFFRKYKNQNLFFTAILIVTGLTLKYAMPSSEIIISNILLAVASIIAGLPVLLRAIGALKAHVISIELLVSIAVIGAFVIGEFNESAIVTFLFGLGDFLEEKTLAKTRSSIKSLAQMAPTTAMVQVNGQVVETDIDDVEIGDVVEIKPGNQVPVDGEILSGHGYLDEAAITGESKEVGKDVGEKVFSGSILNNGFLQVKVTKEADDTTFAKILELVEDAQDTKSNAEKFIDKFARYYTPAVLVIALLVLIFSRDFKLAITVLVLGCPGALVIGAPVSNVAGIGNGAKHGVLVKGGGVMDEFAKIDTFVFDKTGTLTTGQTTLTKIATVKGNNENELLKLIAKAESISDHPLGQAVVNYADDQAIDFANIEISNNEVIKGQGLVVDFVDQPINRLYLGNEKLLQENAIMVDPAEVEMITSLKESGSSLILVADQNQLLQIIGISDSIKSDAKENLAKLKQAGAKKLVMLTGDNEVTANFVAKELGIDEVHAGLLPENKEKMIAAMQAAGQRVAFVGDGINDSPSLARADIGIAMGSGTDVAIETSDVVLMNSTIAQLVYGYQLAKKTVANTRENILIAILVVAFLLVGLLAGFIYMASGMFVHEASILVVILNAMRLLAFGQKNSKNNEIVDLNQVNQSASSI